MHVHSNTLSYQLFRWTSILLETVLLSSLSPIIFHVHLIIHYAVIPKNCSFTNFSGAPLQFVQHYIVRFKKLRTHNFASVFTFALWVFFAVWLKYTKIIFWKDDQWAFHDMAAEFTNAVGRRERRALNLGPTTNKSVGESDYISISSIVINAPNIYIYWHKCS